MAYHKKSLATEPVRRYLLQMIAKSGSEPERLLPERDLAEKLHLSRVTVRRAIEELENVNYIIRLPGRRGAFTNPAMSSKAEHAIGIVISQNYIGQLFSLFLSGLSQKLYEMNIHYCFSLYSKPDKTPQEIAFELENSGFDCIVWHTQAPEDVNVINLLHEHHFPVLTICNPNYPDWKKPASGWYQFDTDNAAKVLASYFVREKCKKVVFYSLDEFFIPAFRKELEENGIAIDNTCIFNNVQKLKKALPSLIENGMDGIFIQRDDLHMKEILHCISAEKDRYKVKILLSPGLATQRDKSEFPHLNIALPDMDYYRHQCVALGGEVANGIADILDSGTIPPGVTLNGYALPENSRKKKRT